MLGDSKAKSQGRDLIRDFDPRADCIDLSTIDADIDGTAGNQAFKFIGTGAFSGRDGELRYSWADYAGTTNDRTFVSADVDGGASPDFQIAICGLHVLTAGDFITEATSSFELLAVSAKATHVIPTPRAAASRRLMPGFGAMLNL
jgi:serralysin